MIIETYANHDYQDYRDNHCSGWRSPQEKQRYANPKGLGIEILAYPPLKRWAIVFVPQAGLSRRRPKNLLPPNQYCHPGPRTSVRAEDLLLCSPDRRQSSIRINR